MVLDFITDINKLEHQPKAEQAKGNHEQGYHIVVGLVFMAYQVSTTGTVKE
jgi:hypothetical protein